MNQCINTNIIVIQYCHPLLPPLQEFKLIITSLIQINSMLYLHHKIISRNQIISLVNYYTKGKVLNLAILSIMGNIVAQRIIVEVLILQIGSHIILSTNIQVRWHMEIQTICKQSIDLCLFQICLTVPLIILRKQLTVQTKIYSILSIKAMAIPVQHRLVLPVHLSIHDSEQVMPIICSIRTCYYMTQAK